jgi:molybdenum cofactor sulfurtransferase
LIYPVDRNYCRNWFSSRSTGFPNQGGSENRFDESKYALFVYTGESNFCGTRYQLDFCRLLHQYGMFEYCGKNVVTLVDGAKLAASHPIRLDKYLDIDILVISFYKIFGYPTGVGCILVRKHCPRIHQTLRSKRYYGGGTILLADAYDYRRTFPKKLNNSCFHEIWEDGTINFIDILVGLETGMNWIEKVIGGMELVERHVGEICSYARGELLKLSYPNKQPMIRIYEEDASFSSSSFCGRGNSIITFNVYQPNGDFINYSSVYCACLNNHIIARSGLLCNPGCCQYYLGLTGEGICNIADSTSSCWNLTVGAVRISFGIHSCLEDVSKLIDTLQQLGNFAWQNSGLIMSRTEKESVTSCLCFHQPKTELQNIYFVHKIFVYPVKGCRGMPVNQWPITSNGLLYDRKYCIVNTMTNSLLSIRHYPRLASLKVFIFLSTTGASTSFVAQLVFEVSDSVQIPNVPKVCAVYESDLRQTYIHCWLSCVLQVPCQLMTVEDFESLSTSGKSKEMKERYRNDAHLLVVHLKSVETINEFLTRRNSDPIHLESFRPNLVVKDDPSANGLADLCERNAANVKHRLMLPLEEDQWRDVAWLYNSVNGQKAVKLSSVGDCVRCMTICVNPETVGQLREDREPWLLLSTYRVPGITERKDSKESAKDCVKRRGPLFGRLYNVSATSENWEWIKLDESRFQA